MKNLLDIFAGKKTYVLGVLGIIYGIAGYFTNNLNQDTAIVAVLAGLGLLTGRRAVSRIE